MAEFTRPATWEDVKRLARYLEEAGADLFARETSYAIRIDDEITVDVQPATAGLPWEALREYVQDVMIDGIRVRAPSLEGLLKTKSGARPKHQIDAAAITRALDELRNDG